MSDQAQVLRGLMEQREEIAALDPAPFAHGQPAQTLAVTSGKGGVGKSCIALNLGIALAQAGRSVCLLDGNLGLGNIDLLCGLNGYWNLSHVVSGARTLAEISLEGPHGLRVIPGASGLIDVADCSPQAQREILQQLEELEQEHEFLLIDTGTGIHRTVRQFVAAADLGLVVTTPEPTAIADAYATIKALSAHTEFMALEVVVNCADSIEQARDIVDRLQRTTRMFLRSEVGAAGSIPHDTQMIQAVRRQTPCLTLSPRSPASRALEKLARRVDNVLHHHPKADDPSFFHRLWSGLARNAT
jgi:flagellar biosynthesis protein FlhG